MDSVGLMLCVKKFVKEHPDDHYNFVVMTAWKNTMAIDANEHKSEFQKAGEILEEME